MRLPRRPSRLAARQTAVTDGRTFAFMAVLLAVAGLITSVIGQVNPNVHTQLAGLTCVLCGLVFGLISFRDFR